MGRVICIVVVGLAVVVAAVAGVADGGAATRSAALGFDAARALTSGHARYVRRATTSGTHVSGTIAFSTTWTLAASPYVVDGNLTVASGATLTVEPGVVVKLEGQFRSINVAGALVAVGTAGSRITFTSLSDDSVAGDTGGDGPTVGARGQWYELAFTGSSASTLKFVDVRYGGYADAQVRVSGGCGAVAIQDSSVTFSGLDGVRVGNTSGCAPAVTLTRSTVASSGRYGIRVFDGSLQLRDDSVVESNASTGVQFEYTGGFTGSSSLFEDSEIRGNGGDGVYVLIAESLAAATVFPKAYGNNVYGNAGLELNGTPGRMDVDWVFNYFGADVGYYENNGACPDRGKLAFVTSTSNPIAGPNIGGEEARVVGNNVVYCNFDKYRIDRSDLAGQEIGDGTIPIGWTWGDSHCPNPTGELSDPVNSATGSFTHAVTDVALPGVGIPFVLTRSYDSQDPRAGSLGAGWSHSLAAQLTIAASGDATLRAGDGQLIEYRKQPDGSFSGPPGRSSTLVQLAGGSYELRRLDQSVLAFSSAGRLTGVRDRNGQGLALAYDGAGRLATVADSAARTITFTHDANGRLTRVALPDGRDVLYAYTDGRLSSVTDLRDKLWTYTYDTYGWLEKEVDPLNHTVFRNVYSRWGRVVEQYDALNNKTSFAWDWQTQTATATDARGKQWKDVYDGYRLIKRIDPLGNTWQFGYDTDHNLASVTDPRGKTTSMSYDGRGNVLSRTAPAPLSYQESWAYNARNDVTSHTNGRGKTTSYGYDGNGNLTSVVEPGSVTTGFTRNASTGLVTSVTDPRGKTTSFGYDAAHNLTSITSPLGFVQTMSYDGSGRLLNVVDPRGNRPGADPSDYMTVYGYNDGDQPLTVRDPLGNTTSFAYDNDGRHTSTTDAKTHTTSWGYDAADRLTSVTAPGGAVTAYEYDAVGNLTKRTAPGTRVTTYAYDDASRLTSTTSPTNRVWSYGYDGAGNLTSTTTPSGGTIASGYDAVNRLTSVDYSESTPDVGYAYDANGNRTQLTDGAGSETYAYDDLDRLTAVTRGADSFGYGYDPAGNLSSRTYPGGRQTSYSFDDDGRLATAASNAQTFTFGYDAAGAVTTLAYPNGAAEARSYDRAGRVSEVRHERSGTTIASAAYSYDAIGNPTQITRDTGVETYAYDDRDRLTEACYGATCTDYIRYAYDAVGNRSSETRPSGTTTYTYNLADELLSATGPGGTTSYTFDANGNQTQAGGRTFSYDLANRLVSTTAAGVTTSYGYDGDGKRLTATTGTDVTRFLWDANAELPQLALERDKSGAALRSYLLAGEPLAFDAGGASHYLHPDARGSVVATTGATGALEWRSGYEPYGAARNEQLVDPTAPLSPLRFTGGYLDPTGLYHLRARQYDPATGRFGGLDPLPASVTAPYLASYHYAANRPGVLVDPSGMGATWADGTIGAAKCVTGFTDSAACMAVGLIGPGKFMRGAVLGWRGIAFGWRAGRGAWRASRAGRAAKAGPGPRATFVAKENGVVVPTSRARLEGGFQSAGFPSRPTSGAAGTEYTLPDGSLVRVMEPSGQAPLRASFTNSNGGPINPFTGRPVQPPPGLTSAQRLAYVRARTHVELFP